jgi:hypothetical protein
MSRRSKRRRRPPATPASLPPARRIIEQYTPPAPRQLPELRGQLASWLAAEAARFYFVSALAGRQWLPPGLDMTAGAALIARQEHARVTSGQLYWVSSAMTELACHAAASMPHRNLYPHDLPSPSGFMVFETPLGGYVNTGGRDVQIAAVSWGPWDGPHGAWDQGGIWFSFYSHPAAVIPRQFFTDGTADLAGLGQLLIPLTDDPGDSLAGLSPVAATLPPVLPDNEAGWPFGQLAADNVIPDGSTGPWALVVRAAWRLMQQPLAAQATEQADRPTRRRLTRAGLPDTGVRIVRIRRRERPPGRRDSTGARREYDHQWWVTGHWRTYWCGPGRTRPEGRYITEYLAGPDDKPVRGTERVRVWDR